MSLNFICKSLISSNSQVLDKMMSSTTKWTKSNGVRDTHRLTVANKMAAIASDVMKRRLTAARKRKWCVFSRKAMAALRENCLRRIQKARSSIMKTSNHLLVRSRGWGKIPRYQTWPRTGLCKNRAPNGVSLRTGPPNILARIPLHKGRGSLAISSKAATFIDRRQHGKIITTNTMQNAGQSVQVAATGFRYPQSIVVHERRQSSSNSGVGLQVGDKAPLNGTRYSYATNLAATPSTSKNLPSPGSGLSPRARALPRPVVTPMTLLKLTIPAEYSFPNYITLGATAGAAPANNGAGQYGLGAGPSGHCLGSVNLLAGFGYINPSMGNLLQICTGAGHGMHQQQAYLPVSVPVAAHALAALPSPAPSAAPPPLLNMNHHHWEHRVLQIQEDIVNYLEEMENLLPPQIPLIDLTVTVDDGASGEQDNAEDNIAPTTAAGAATSTEHNHDEGDDEESSSDSEDQELVAGIGFMEYKTWIRGLLNGDFEP